MLIVFNLAFHGHSLQQLRKNYNHFNIYTYIPYVHQYNPGTDTV